MYDLLEFMFGLVKVVFILLWLAVGAGVIYALWLVAPSAGRTVVRAATVIQDEVNREAAALRGSK